MTSRTTRTTPTTPRRTVLLAAAALTTATAATTTGCGSDDGGGGDGGTESSAPPSPSGTAGGTPLASTSEIPVGGGTVFADRKVVVTQPTEGEFKAFSAICTHQGCTVNKVANGTIDCPCHGSKYSITDGAVTAGPAPRPLPAEEITVSGETITLA
ncbi:Rieske (2Fe-2S) protein [Streptomyces sp. R302]|uniref:Rieske (2Fe-2S) protein n=1 Tax=unclassified Streptomyces TaxID=2593676 RepID=UPI00145D039A|nr:MULTISPECIES: Rieske (2Fe-2S) protein [unclassified Streptomyces]NML54436.1 Rieske (2Fe-2S) protein [Streptomyces sp. R301]NML81698.1 Rieske (2Fe-2S) protein [Streptomyces sp. R302]